MVEKGIKTYADLLEYEKTPLEQRLKAFNTYDLIKQGAALDPEALAISYIQSGDRYQDPVQIDYGTLMTNINRTANLFHHLGVGSNDVVSFLLPAIPQTHYVFWGGEAVGIINAINPMLETGTLRDILQAAGTKVLVALGDSPGSDIWQKVEQIRGDLPQLKTIVRILGSGEPAEGVIDYEQVIQDYNGDHLDFRRTIDPDDIASILHTGGTTGTPKLAPRSHLNEVTMALMVGIHNVFHPGETVLGGLPLFHNYGLMGTGLYPFSIGAHVVMLSPVGYRDPSVLQNMWKIIDHYRAVFFNVVPTVISMLLEIPREDADLSSLRFTICGAAPLSVDLANRFVAYSGAKVVEGYGLTEGTSSSSMVPINGVIKIGSVGLRWPYQEMKIFILDAAGHYLREAETDEIGSVCIKGPNVVKGYLEVHHNKGIWVKEGWLKTGDMGRQDADHYFWITGREKELIIRGGHNIDPALIEEPLYRLPGVQLAAAVGRPDARVGEMPVAYVQLQPGSALTEASILEHLNRTVGERAAIPREVFIVEQMPLTSVGKIFKPALQRATTRRVYRDVLQDLGNMVERVEIQVGEDKIHGSLALITIKPAPSADRETISRRVEQLLSVYTTRYRLILEA
ncbi:acyl-CoA synthetase [bacterium]|nr:acyl-CoA synthetase [bacterium]